MKKTAMPKFSALEKLRKEKHKFEASLIYMSSKNLLDRATRKNKGSQIYLAHTAVE